MSQLLLDILPLKSGRSPEEAKAYFDGLSDVFARHGLTRSDQALTALKTLRGEVKADVVNLWESENAPASMQGMQADPDYQAKIPERDSIFDLENATVILTQRT